MNYNQMNNNANNTNAPATSSTSDLSTAEAYFSSTESLSSVEELFPQFSLYSDATMYDVESRGSNSAQIDTGLYEEESYSSSISTVPLDNNSYRGENLFFGDDDIFHPSTSSASPLAIQRSRSLPWDDMVDGSQEFSIAQEQLRRTRSAARLSSRSIDDLNGLLQAQAEPLRNHFSKLTTLSVEEIAERFINTAIVPIGEMVTFHPITTIGDVDPNLCPKYYLSDVLYDPHLEPKIIDSFNLFNVNGTIFGSCTEYFPKSDVSFLAASNSAASGHIWNMNTESESSHNWNRYPSEKRPYTVDANGRNTILTFRCHIRVSFLDGNERRVHHKDMDFDIMQLPILLITTPGLWECEDPELIRVVLTSHVDDRTTDDIYGIPDHLPTTKMFFLWTTNYEKFGVKLRLVCVELNPGPQNKMIISYLKHMESLENARASNPQRVFSGSKEHESNQRKIEKFRDQTIKKLKGNKRVFLPEGFFDLKVDDSTKMFVSSLFGEVKSIVSEGVTVKLDFVSQFTESIQYIIDYIKRQAGLLKDFFLFVLRLARKYVSEYFTSVIDLAFLLINGQPDVFYDMEPEANVGDAVIMAAYFGTLSKHIKQLEFVEFLKTFNKMKDTSKSADSLLGWIMSFVRSLITFINEKLGLSMNPEFVKSDMDEYYTEYYAIRDEFRKPEHSDHDLSLRVFILQEALECKLRTSTDISGRDSLLYLINCFKPLVKYCETNINPNNGPRIEPMAMLVCGPTGVGKSTFTMPFILALMARTLPSELREAFLLNHNTFINWRTNENVFWDGTKPQQIVYVYDDYGQQRDSAGTPNPDGYEMIRLKNNAPYHLHFSAVEDKQKHFAKPQMIYATTNLNTLNFQSLMCSEAVIRRFDIKVIQVPRPEFCIPGFDVNNPWTRRMNIEAVREKYPFDPADPWSYAEMKVNEYIEWDFVRGCVKPGGKTFDFESLLELAVSKTREFQAKGDSMLQYHTLMKQKYLPEAGVMSLRDVLSTVLDSIGTTIAAQTKATLSFTKEQLTFWNAFVAGVAIVGASYSMFRYLTQKVFPEPEAGYEKHARHGNVKKQDKNVKNKEAVKTVKRNNARANKQAMRNLNAEGLGTGNMEFLSKLVKRNMYRLRVKGQPNFTGFALFVRGSTFVVPKHFEEILCSETPDAEGRIIVEFYNPLPGTVSFAIDWLDDISIYPGDSDYQFYKLQDGTCRLHSDIVSHFPPKKSIIEDNSYNAHMFVVRESFNGMVLNPQVSIGDSATYVSLGKEYTSNALSYQVLSCPGDCGTPLVSTDGRFSSPMILGIHTAGSQEGIFQTKWCVGTLIAREDVEDALSSFDEAFFSEKLPIGDIKLSVEGFNTLSECKQPPMPSKTKLEYSDLQGKLWPTITKPSRLMDFTLDGQLIRPAKLARDKYKHNEVYIDQSSLFDIRPHILKLVLPKDNLDPWKPRVYTFQEAIEGVDGVDFADSMSRSTSPGYPYVLNNPGTGKAAWFGKDGDFTFDSNLAIEFERRHYELLGLAKQGIREDHVFIDYLKDARVANEKSDKGKTRQFMACGMDYLVLCKRYFGDFIRSVCSNRIRNGVAVGINPVQEWDQLAKYLLPNVDYTLTAGDYSAYDAKIPVPIMLEVLTIIEHFYHNATDEDRLVRKVLFQEIINSRHVADGKIYEFVGGNPSGQPMTSVINSIANILMIYYAAAMSEFYDFNKWSPSEIFSGSRIITFGDDNVVSSVSSLKYLFGQEALGASLKKYLNMDYTIESKDDKVADNRSLSEVSFLKRTWKMIDGRWYCPLQLDVILETLNWQKKGATKVELCLRVDAALVELSYHGKDTYSIYAPKIISAAAEVYGHHSIYDNFSRTLKGELSLAI